MTTYFTEDFEGGSNGAAITTGNSTFTIISGTPPTFSTADKFVGSQSMSVAITTAAISSGRSVFGSLVSLAYVRFYMKVPTWPTGNFYPHSFLAAGAARADFRVPNGIPVMRNNTTAVWTSGVTLTANQWYCYERKLDVTNSVQSLTVWDASGTQVVASGNQTYTTGTVDQSILGNTSSVANVSAYFDALQGADASIGPIVTVAPSSRYQLNGSSVWVPMYTQIM